jgi:hypothetical protein
MVACPSSSACTRGRAARKRFGALVLVLLLSAACAGARERPEGAADAAQKRSNDSEISGPDFMSSVWSWLRRAVLPEPLGIMLELRDYITELEAPETRTRESDLKRLDAIFDRAVYLAEGDAMHALLILTWATLPYHRFPAVLPLLDWTITVPVSTESREAFRRRLANLPGMLLEDTPPSLDRDKPPHFFGSAWLQCVLNSPELADAAGNMLEWMEEVFKLEGFRDERDILVNRLGIIFAMQLQRQQAVRPSDIFMLDLNNHESTQNTRR